MIDKNFADCSGIELEQWVARYEDYLESVVGASACTCEKYLFIARRLVNKARSMGCLSCSKLTANAIAEFVRWDTAPRQGQGAQVTLAATRSFIRFLISQTALPKGIDSAIPTIRSYAQAHLPEFLTQAEVDRVLRAAVNAGGSTKRNYAMLVLLARLGLRAHEVALLQLEDIDWRQGTILIRSRKTRQERVLPLRADVAKALIDYLKNSRPSSRCREVFLQHRRPFRRLRSNSVSLIVSRALDRVQVGGRASAAHLFRHAVATSMVNRGVTFRDVADFLGHQSLQSTLVYAKLDLVTLSRVSLQWPGGER